jgi:hypothetical protein
MNEPTRVNTCGRVYGGQSHCAVPCETAGGDVPPGIHLRLLGAGMVLGRSGRGFDRVQGTAARTGLGFLCSREGNTSGALVLK